MKINKKLIEVALPLVAINRASAKEKTIRHGHPSTMHLWWARRPLAAARAVIFAQMVDDPAAYVDVLRADSRLRRKAEAALKIRQKLWMEAVELANKAKESGLNVPEPGSPPSLDETLADQERQRLFRIIEDLVVWENTTNEAVLDAARNEIWQSWRRACADNADHPRANEWFDRKRLPGFHDPFAGGGALPLEALRLGLDSYASDLNPVAVLINKSMIEIPPKFAGRSPINPIWQRENSLIAREWKGAEGLAEDVRYYARWLRDEAEKRIGHLYPKMTVTAEMVKERPDIRKYLGESLTVVAWIWARTVRSPNPAFATVNVPLVSTFMLSTKSGNEAYVEPVIRDDRYAFVVKKGRPRNVEAAKKGTKLTQGSFRCLMSNTPFPYTYIDDEANAGRMGQRLMAVVLEGDRERLYLSPNDEMESVARHAEPAWKPDTASRGTWGSNAQGRRYGFHTFGDYFTPRQLVALTTFADLVQEASELARIDALKAGIPDRLPSLDIGITATDYSNAVAVYLAFAVSKAADRNSSLCFWEHAMDRLRGTFGRQALPMIWDYAETNPFAGAGGDIYGTARSLCEVLDKLPVSGAGTAVQADAAVQSVSEGKVVSTDPPYYDNIGYADLSDFFYVWLRRTLRSDFPDLFATVAVPKAEELVATVYRHGSKEKAEEFFLNGMTRAMHRLAEQAHPAFPVTIYYAFKQSESETLEGTVSTGWETFLDAVIRAGFAISGTWPMRTEQLAGLKGKINALASSVVLVCKKSAGDAPAATRREFINALKGELGVALAHLQRGNIAPVDLAQAAIGPGMAVYTRYSEVLDVNGKPLSVREALALINQTLDESLAEQEGDFDADTRWALTWFEQSGFEEGEFGLAEQLSKSKNTSVAGMVEAGIVESKRGKVRLLRPDDLSSDWDPRTDARLTAWEIVHHLIRALTNGGEDAAANLVSKLGANAEIARELAYRLFTLCERKRRTGDALTYNGLVQSWPEIVRLARDGVSAKSEQGALFEPEQ
jgi:putative DNA methylase